MVTAIPSVDGADRTRRYLLDVIKHLLLYSHNNHGGNRNVTVGYNGRIRGAYGGNNQRIRGSLRPLAGSQGGFTSGGFGGLGGGGGFGGGALGFGGVNVGFVGSNNNAANSGSSTSGSGG